MHARLVKRAPGGQQVFHIVFTSTSGSAALLSPSLLPADTASLSSSELLTMTTTTGTASGNRRESMVDGDTSDRLSVWSTSVTRFPQKDKIALRIGWAMVAYFVIAVIRRIVTVCCFGAGRS